MTKPSSTHRRELLQGGLRPHGIRHPTFQLGPTTSLDNFLGVQGGSLTTLLSLFHNEGHEHLEQSCDSFALLVRFPQVPRSLDQSEMT